MRSDRALILLAIAGLTIWAFWPATGAPFLNWDDPDTFVANAALREPPAALIAWAFSTTHMGHYQPLSWLAVAWLGGTPVDAGRLHVLAVVLHALTAALLVVTAATLSARHTGDDAPWLPAAAVAAVFALHPLRVEPVAWASALPYLLSAVPLLVAVICWTIWLRRGGRRWWTGAAVAFVVSQLARVTAPLLPLVLVWLARADPLARPIAISTLVRAAAPLAAVSAALAVAEASAREAASLSDVALLPRLASAVAQPTVYLWRTVVPAGLSPLDVLPRDGRIDWGPPVVAAIAMTAVVLATRQFAGRRATIAVWGGYVALLLPFLGLWSSGVQATADRYTYVASMALAIAGTAAVVRVPRGWRRAALVMAGAAAVAGVVATRAQLGWWRDSETLWTRAVALDADNDVALYNLALAQASAGKPGGAIESLQRVVALVPDHAPAERQLRALVADREQAAGDAAAAAGRFADAITAYDRALDADPARARVRVTRGMALLQAGRFARAAADLETTVSTGLPEPAVVSALAFAWASTGRAGDAVALLRRAHEARPDDAALAGNLARLLLTVDPPSLRDPAGALALAAPLNDQSGGRDPRVLALLADALAATGRARDAREALGVAIDLATGAGDRALAARLDARRRALAR